MGALLLSPKRGTAPQFSAHVCCGKTVAHLSSRNKSSDHGHNGQGPKRGEAAMPLSRELGPRLVQCGLGRGLLPYQAASSSIQPFGHNRRGPKIGLGSAPFGVGAGSPSNTKSPGLRPSSIPSGILMHPAVWPHKDGSIIWGGGSDPFLGWELFPHLAQRGLDQDLPPCQLPS